MLSSILRCFVDLRRGFWPRLLRMSQKLGCRYDEVAYAFEQGRADADFQRFREKARRSQVIDMQDARA